MHSYIHTYEQTYTCMCVYLVSASSQKTDWYLYLPLSRIIWFVFSFLLFIPFLFYVSGSFTWWSEQNVCFWKISPSSKFTDFYQSAFSGNTPYEFLCSWTPSCASCNHCSSLFLTMRTDYQSTHGVWFLI